MSTAAVPTERHTHAQLQSRAADTGLRHRLRSATSAAHAQLDKQLGALDLNKLADYRRFLEASAAALLPLEDVLLEAGVARMFPDWELRSRRAAILHDLARIGGKVRPLGGPPPLDFGGVLGTMYVLERSRLGATVLLKTVAQSPNRMVAEATAYLRHGEGEQLWPSFLVMLEQHAAALRDDTGAVNGANRAFDLFAQATARLRRTRSPRA